MTIGLLSAILMSLDVQLRVTNLGRTPALSAHTNMIVAERVETEEIHKFVAENRVDHPHNLFLSPSDNYVRQWYPILKENDK